MTKLTVEQHQMLEDLTGLQHTKTGKVREKQNRSRDETVRLGLRDPNHDLQNFFRRMKCQSERTE